MSTATHLRSADSKRGICSLAIEGDRYVFNGPSGRHSLAVSVTDEARLDAHWDGYVEVNGGEPTAAEWAAVANDRELVDDAEPVSWWQYRDNGTPGPETNAHLQLDGASRTFCGREFPADAVWESGHGQSRCRSCELVQERAEKRVELFEA